MIIAPGFPRLKEWAYAGSFFNWSGAVASHLLAGDGVEVWLPPLVFLMFVIVSWALRPADRRLPNAGLAPETRPLAWAVPIGILRSSICRFVSNAARGQRRLPQAGS